MTDFNGDSDDGGPLTTQECKRLRRMLRDDDYARRFKAQAKAWVTIIGGVAALLVATKTLLGELILRHLK